MEDFLKQSTNREREEILNRLLSLKSRISVFSRKMEGICHLFWREQNLTGKAFSWQGKKQQGNLFNSLLVEACVQEGVFSGDRKYPIAHHKVNYYDAYLSKDRWNIFTKYGRTRRAVLRRCIHILKDH